MNAGIPCLILAEEVWGSTLQAVRSLGRAGIEVYVASAGSGSLVYGRSRWCAGAADFGGADVDAFCDEAIAWMERRAPGNTPVVVIPVSDRLVEAMHLARDRFPPRFRLSIPEPVLTEALLDKATSFELAERAGLAVPPWARVASADDIDAAAALRLPVAVRPTSWSTAGDEYFKVVRCADAAELDAALRRYLEHGATLIVQEYVTGRDSDVELAIIWRGRATGATAVCTGRKRRQASADGGVMVWGETAEIADVDALARSFLDDSGFVGLGGLEFIRADGVPWFIEFNPRLEAIHFMATAAGLDTVLFEYRSLAAGDEPADLPRQRPATAWIGSAWLARVQGNPGALPSALADRWAFGKSPGRIRAVWTWNDPVPGVVVAARLVRRGAANVGAMAKRKEPAR